MNRPPDIPRILVSVDLARESDFFIDTLRICPSHRQVVAGGEQGTIQPRVMQVLVALARAKGAVLSREDLIETCWNGITVGDDAINRCIAKVRQIADFGGGSHFEIETIPRVGYRLKTAVSVVATETVTSEPQEPTEATAAPHQKPSLAVLPFSNFSQHPEQDYFAEGMMEEIVTALSRIRSIFVIGSGSSRSFKGRPIDVSEAARQLGVRYILEGSIRKSGLRIRISVKLTDAIQGAQIWAERFERTLDDVFALQDEVALSIAGVVEPTLYAVESRHVARRPVDSLGCYELYLQAAALRTSLHKGEVLKAIELLDRALELDPGFAPALGQAASCHSLVVLNNWSDDPEWHRRQGVTMAERAISAGSDDAAVLAQAANALMDLDNDVGRARALIDRAITLNRGSAYAQFVSGVVSLIEGDGETAARHFQEAARLDPLSSLGEKARVHVAMACGVQGDFVEAARLYRETTYRTPRIHLLMAAVYGYLGDLYEARKELALYTGFTSVPPDVMVNRTITHAGFRDRVLEGLRRTGALNVLPLPSRKASRVRVP
jgi:TolB-like protein